VLLEYCESIKAEDLLKQHPSFANASMQYLLLHMANCYFFWLGEVALKKKMEYLDYQTVHSLAAIRTQFETVNHLVNKFLNTDWPEAIPYEIRGALGTTTPLKLFTHVITHEYHHKGQLLSMSRFMGYTPVDTDVLR